MKDGCEMTNSQCEVAEILGKMKVADGVANRMLDHEKECEHEIQNGVSYNDLSDKHKAICKAGLGLRRVIIKWGLTKQRKMEVRRED